MLCVISVCLVCLDYLAKYWLARPCPVMPVSRNTYLQRPVARGFVIFKQKVKVKERIVLSEIHLRSQNYGTPLVNGITQCYLPPDRGDCPAFTPTGQVGTRFIDPVRMKG